MNTVQVPSHSKFKRKVNPVTKWCFALFWPGFIYLCLGQFGVCGLWFNRNNI